MNTSFEVATEASDLGILILVMYVSDTFRSTALSTPVRFIFVQLGTSC